MSRAFASTGLKIAIVAIVIAVLAAPGPPCSRAERVEKATADSPAECLTVQAGARPAGDVATKAAFAQQAAAAPAPAALPHVRSRGLTGAAPPHSSPPAANAILRI